MEWMWAAFWAWFGWNILAPVAVIIAILIAIGVASIPGAIRRAKCKHLKYFEDGACHAICSDCRKDLGFIGTVRERREAIEPS